MKAAVLLSALACISAQTVVDIAVNDEEERFTTLVQALQTANLVDTLSGDGPFTVFAPTNDAFAALLSELGVTAEQLLARSDLSEILTYHVVSSEVMSSALSNGQIAATVEGSNIVVTIDDSGVRINTAMVAIPDMDATNGVVHAIDKVLIPGFPCSLYQSTCSGLSNYAAYSDCAATVAANPGGMQCRTEHLYFALSNAEVHCPHAQPSATGPCESEALIPATVVEIAVSAGSFTTLVAALTQENLVETLSGAGPFTVFAPTNDAFADLLTELDITSDQLLARSDLSAILQYHVLSGEVMSSSLTDGQTAATLQGARITVTIGDNVMINDATVTSADLEAGNGVVHVINKVLLPPASTASTGTDVDGCNSVHVTSGVVMLAVFSLIGLM
jgi:uncharacterized surface protein with fasciclin (FAS1) repeats